MSMEIAHFTSGTPCNMLWNPLDVDEILRGTPLENVIEFQSNSHILQGDTLCEA